VRSFQTCLLPASQSHSVPCFKDCGRRRASRHGLLELPGEYSGEGEIPGLDVSITHLSPQRMLLDERLLVFDIGTRFVGCSNQHALTTTLTVAQVDDDGESYWVFESRDVRSANCACLHSAHKNARLPRLALSTCKSDRLKVSHAWSYLRLHRTNPTYRMFWVSHTSVFHVKQVLYFALTLSPVSIYPPRFWVTIPQHADRIIHVPDLVDGASRSVNPQI
jgi:hypothetical protein